MHNVRSLHGESSTDTEYVDHALLLVTALVNEIGGWLARIDEIENRSRITGSQVVRLPRFGPVDAPRDTPLQHEG